MTAAFFAFGKKSHQENLAALNNAQSDDDKETAYLNIIKGIAKKDPDSATSFIKEYEAFALSNNHEVSLEVQSQIKFYQGYIAYSKGKYPEGRHFIEQSINIPHNDSLDAKRYFYLALNHKKVGNYSQAVEYFIKASAFFDASNNHYAKASVLVNLSNVLTKTEQYEKALEYLNEALELAEKHDLDRLNRTVYNAMGTIFLKMEDYNLALNQFTESYNEARLQKYVKGQFYTLINIAEAKRRLGSNAEALGHLQEAVLLLDTLNNPAFESSVYYELGDFFAALNNKKEAEYYLNRSLAFADSTRNYPEIKKIYKSFQILYENIGDYEKSLNYFKKHEEIKDLIISRENTLKVSQLNSEFQLDRKEKELKLLEKEKLLKESQIESQKAQNERDKIFIYLLIGLGVLLLVLLLAFAGISVIRSKKNAILKEKNDELGEQKIKIESQKNRLEEVNEKLEGSNKTLVSKNVEIESQKEELRAQRDLLNLTHEQLKVRNKDVTDSIHYAQKIQQAMLNSSFHIDDAGVDHFTFYKPRDIVSGDFYWSNVVDDELIVAIGDCTGHGVPGAFMSCLGISLLNEIVFGREITAPHTILEELRNSVIQLIATDKNADLQIGDGMDIAILCLNLKTNKIKFSGAMNGIVVVSGEELIEIKGDKSPIGQHIIPNHKFTMSEHQLKLGDAIFATTDGYKDQFGGPKGKKLGKRRLHEKLAEIAPLSIPVQKTEIIKFYKSWRKYEEQIDDVCLFGMKIKS